MTAPATGPAAGFLDRLTVDDLYTLEDMGVTLDDLDMPEGSMPPARVLHALGWLAGRANDPTFTPEAARRLPLADMVALTGSATAGGADAPGEALGANAPLN